MRRGVRERHCVVAGRAIASSPMVTLQDIRDAHARISGTVHRTPVFGSRSLAALAGAARLDLKCESLQKTGSFKARGALNKLGQLSAEERSRGVVTVSAGNHAQALAWAAQQTGVRCTVVMPAAAVRSKVDASRGYGADVILHGTSMDAFQRARDLSTSEGFVFVHPFDDDNIIQGTGTVGLELLEQTETPDVVVVPIGGGGLIAGVAVAIKESSTVKGGGCPPGGGQPTGAATPVKPYTVCCQ